jgi:hypothetical protein
MSYKDPGPRPIRVLKSQTGILTPASISIHGIMRTIQIPEIYSKLFVVIE